MSAKHTPGPWTLVPGDHEASSEIWADEVIVADVHTHVVGQLSFDDARLIAAAPDLLAALEAVNAKLGSRPYGTGSYLPKALRDQVSAAIAKATGGLQ